MSNGSEHLDERCVHAVDGPDWAGLRELYPAEVDYTEMVAEARDYAKWSNETRYGNLSHTGMIFELADAVESLLAIEQRLTDHIVQLAAERDALQARLASWDGFTGESVGDAEDALITDPLLARIHELEAENEKLRGSRNGFKTLWKSACKRSEEWESSWAEMEAERNALQARLDAMTVEWAVHWIPGDTYHDAPTEADAVSLAGEFVRSKAQAVQRLVGPWTVVPEGEQP